MTTQPTVPCDDGQKRVAAERSDTLRFHLVRSNHYDNFDAAQKNARRVLTFRRHFTDVPLALRHEIARLQRAKFRSADPPCDSASHRRLRLRVSPSHRDSASHGHKFSISARILLSRRPTLGPADNKNDLAR